MILPASVPCFVIDTDRKRIWAEATAEMEALAEAVETYQVKVLKKTDKSDVRKTDWSVMMQQVQAAAVRYENEPLTGGVKGTIKRALHRIREAGPVMGHWCSLLPAGDHGGTIAGAFTVLTTAANRSVEVRESIFEAVQDVPDYIRHTGKYLEIYEINKSDHLEVKSADLCRSILVLFRHIMAYLNESSARRAFKSITQGDSYEERLLKSKQDVEKLTGKIQIEAQLLEQERLREVLGDTARLATKEDIVALVTKEDMMALEQRLSKGMVSKEIMGKCFQTLLESSSLFDSRTGQARVHEIEDGTTSSHVLESPCASQEQPRETIISRKKVLAMLDFDRDMARDDVERCRDFGATFDLRAQDKASWVIHSKELQLWLTLPESRDLLINGQCSDVLEQLSPFSLVCAELVSLFGVAKDAIVASHFCGLHSDYNEEGNTGLTGMLASLIGQIVDQSKRKKFDLDYSCVEKDRKKISRLNLRALCKVFEMMVRQLPKNKIFYCVIDGISIYEAMSKPNAEYVLAKIYKLLKPAVGKESATMKLLLTCPGESMIIGDPQCGFSVEPGEILNVDCVDGNKQGVLETEELRRSVNSLRGNKE